MTTKTLCLKSLRSKLLFAQCLKCTELKKRKTTVRDRRWSTQMLHNFISEPLQSKEDSFLCAVTVFWEPFTLPCAYIERITAAVRHSTEQADISDNRFDTDQVRDTFKQGS